MAHLRNVKPPIYNSARLKEKPIPPIAIHGNHDNVQPSTSASSRQTIPSDETFESAAEESDEDLLIEPLIYESDHDIAGNVSKDPLELPPNESIGSVEFHGFDETLMTNAIENNDVSDMVQNTEKRNSTNEKQISIEPNSAPTRLAMTGGSSAANGDLADENQLTIGVNLSTHSSASTNGNVDEIGNSTNHSTNTIGGADLSVIDRNLANENEVITEDNVPVARAGNSAANSDLDNEIQTNVETNPEHSTAAAITKIEQPAYFYEIHSGNDADIDDVLDEPEEIVWEKDPEVVIKIGRCGIPQPWNATDDKMIKREGDPMSGDISFNATVHKK